ncbi:MAG: zinc-dependent peptidase [Armatimonadaceae bacterium]
MFAWFRDLKRKRLLNEPFPLEWDAFIRADVPHDFCLTSDEQQALREHVQVFIAEKTWEGGSGFTITDEMKVTISAQACLLLLGLPNHNFYPNLRTIIVYPGAYRVREKRPGVAGVVHIGRSSRLGEAWTTGQVILGWDNVRRTCRDPEDGHNVVLHEFAHLLDMRDGYADGVPPLHEGQAQYDEWAAVMAPEYDRLVAQVQYGMVEVLDGYGATNHAEFFAVATECFFEKPLQLRERHPRLYEVLQRYYRQDTAARAEACVLPDLRLDSFPDTDPF